ncbi:MAG: cell wall metabolism sensor histidine kinase WalK [Candidatus Omnitrophica bacterium]|nr:cell wall metabolism sensor histidine kinase WalK [Candidatus Omnitrophota bacterium]MBU1997099.1 cell wall metabolism sensor histidine kinase WalK [Candidatus Omnitrophota bacterium]MBU4334416.1 cell wall metabolism sensor histidine kinase WalK [Candidatus Omnitrophota bacterium]
MRDKLIWKFLGAYVPLILFAVIVLNFFVSFSLRRHFEEQISERLYSNAVLVGTIIKADMERGDIQEIQKRTGSLSKQLGLRITVIDEKGIVLGDSENNPQELEKHADRPEVIEAFKNGKGETKRFSDTLNYNMKYLAVPFYSNGKTIGVVRLAIALNEVDAQIRVIYRAVLFGGIIAAILMIFVGYYISRSITNPISEMKTIAQRISSGDFSQKIKVRSKDELGSLANSLNKMAEDLQAQIESLKKMDKVRTDFVANVSHELKTPLTSIKGFVETLQDGALDDQENAQKFLGIIRKHADYLTNIVDDLLTLSEAERGLDRLQRTTFDLKDLLDEIVLGFGHAFKEKKLNMDFEIKGKDFKIAADRGKINQVFVNIIDNATKYTDKNGRIKLLISNKDNKISVLIEDNGVGIPPKDISRVFERFYRVDKARSREVGGTGLGLAIVKHIVSLHNGEVSIDSVVKKGTKVSVVLPCA